MADNKENKVEDVKKEPVKVKITLDKPHIDSGVEHPAGSVLETDSLTARWLVDNKVGKLTN